MLIIGGRGGFEKGVGFFRGYVVGWWGFGRDERVKGDMWEGRGEDEEGVSEWLR